MHPAWLRAGCAVTEPTVIGLIMPDVASFYCQEILRGVNQAIAKLDKDLIVYTSGVIG